MSRLWDHCTDAKFLRALHLGRALFFVALIPIALRFGWLESVTFVSVLSIWALVEGALAAYAGSRAEVKQDTQGDAS